MKDRRRKHTGVNSSDGALNNHNRQTVQSGQGTDDLANSRELRHHVEEQGDERHEAEVQHGDGAVALLHPLGQHKALGAFPADDGAQPGEDEQRQRRREGVDDHALDARDGAQLRVREEDAGSETFATCQH